MNNWYVMAPRTVARVAGGFYLAFVLFSVLAGMVGHIGMPSCSSARGCSRWATWSSCRDSCLGFSG